MQACYLASGCGCGMGLGMRMKWTWWRRCKWIRLYLLSGLTKLQDIRSGSRISSYSAAAACPHPHRPNTRLATSASAAVVPKWKINRKLNLDIHKRNCVTCINFGGGPKMKLPIIFSLCAAVRIFLLLGSAWLVLCCCCWLLQQLCGTVYKKSQFCIVNTCKLYGDVRAVDGGGWCLVIVSESVVVGGRAPSIHPYGKWYDI